MSDFDPYQQWLGIPPNEQPPDHYRLLGLCRFEPDRNVIQTATDDRMALVRVYQTGPRAVWTQKLLNELATAKLCLLNPYSKAEYDASLATTGSAEVADALLPSSLPSAAEVSNSLATPHLRIESRTTTRRTMPGKSPGWWWQLLAGIAIVIASLMVWAFQRGLLPAGSPAVQSVGENTTILSASSSGDSSAKPGHPDTSGVVVAGSDWFRRFSHVDRRTSRPDQPGDPR